MATFTQTFTVATNPWEVTHNLGDSNVFWVVYDDSGEYLLPTSAVATSDNVFTFNFDTAITGTAVILSILDLISFASTQPFTDLATVKQALGLAADDSSEDTSLTRLIAGVSEEMKNYMRRQIVETAHTDEAYDGQWQNRLVLRNFPVIAASGVSITVDDAAFASTNFAVDYGSGILLTTPTGTTFPGGVQNVKVTYVSGEADGVPQDLNHACVKQVLYERRLQNARHTIALANSSIAGVFSETYITGEWAPGVERILMRYRKRSV